jgi:hypothetical protein
MRITNQYIWNFILSLFFIVLLVVASMGIAQYSTMTVRDLGLFDLAIITLATWRLIRLFVYDAISTFFRDQFLDEVLQNGEKVLVKPARGLRRALAELIACPWCVGVWFAAMVTALYVLAPVLHFVFYILALSAIATYLQILSNLTGHYAEHIKHKNEKTKAIQ